MKIAFMNLRAVLVSFILLFPLTGFCQSDSLVFTVLDSLMEPIEFAFFVASQPGEGMVSSGVTDAEGRVVSTYQRAEDSIYIVIQKIGYFTLRKGFLLSDLHECKGVFVLTAQTYSLREASVKAKRVIPEVQNNDTVKLGIAYVRDSTESNVAELLSKVPGLELLSNGSLKYRGQTVSRVKLDGKDLFGELGYTKSLRQLPAELVNEVVAIESYHDDPVLSTLEQSNETVLNLETSETSSSRLGSLELAAGLDHSSEPVYDNHLTGLVLAEKNGFILNLSQKNIRNTLRSVRGVGEGGLQYNASDPLSNSQSFTVHYSELFPPINLPYTSQPIVANASLLEGGLIFLHRSTSGEETRISLNHGNSSDFLRQESHSRSVSKSAAFNLSTVGKNSAAESTSGVRIDHKGSSKRPLISYRIIAELTGGGFNESSQLESVNFHRDFDYRSNAKSATGTIGFRVNSKINNSSAIQAFSRFRRASQENDLRSDLEPSLQRILYAVSSDSAYSIDQQQNSESQILESGIKYFKKSRIGVSEWYINGERLQRASDLTQELPNLVEIETDTAHVRTIIRAGSKLRTLIAENWLVSLNGQLYTQRLDKQNWQPQIGYSLGVGQLSGRFENFTLQVSRAISFSVLPAIAATDVVNSPFSFVRYELQDSPDISDKVSLRFRRPLFKGAISLNANFDYSWSIREAGPLFQLQQNASLESQNTLFSGRAVGGRLYAEHTGIKRAYTVRLTGAYLRTSFPSNVEGVNSRMVSDLVDFSLLFRFPRVRGFMSAVTIGSVLLQQGGEFDITQLNSDIGINLKYKFEKCLLSFFSDFSTTLPEFDGKRVNFHLGNVSFQYYLNGKNKKSITVGVLANNLFPSKAYRSVVINTPFVVVNQSPSLSTNFQVYLDYPLF